ncbi:MAG: hypothetical protein GF344_20120 [Chitinivibrionales bacterium]|nr:hypothetical protein [Chitinivibrionales bacterium]MBD3358921.1 hypothetical protein [Chitinivibrionales bacterium]
MEVINQKYGPLGLRVLGLDGWDGSTRQVKKFIGKAGISFPVLMNGSEYIEQLGTIDNRGAFFIVDSSRAVKASCDDGYRSYSCFEPAVLDSVAGSILPVPKHETKSDSAAAAPKDDQ